MVWMLSTYPPLIELCRYKDSKERAAANRTSDTCGDDAVENCDCAEDVDRSSSPSDGMVLVANFAFPAVIEQ